MSSTEPMVSLSFPLEVDDGWPPVAAESLRLRISPEGYTAVVPPLFVKDLSVGDVIDATLGEHHRVESWHHVVRSGRTTIWLLRLRSPNQIEEVLAKLRALGCDSVGFESAGCYAVDVPEAVAIDSVDAILHSLDSDSVAVAFPSMRHPDSERPDRG